MNRSGLSQQVFDNRDLNPVGPVAKPTRFPPVALPVFLWQGHGLHPHQFLVKLRRLLPNRLHPELPEPDRAYGLRCNLPPLHETVRFVTCLCAWLTNPLRETTNRVGKLQFSYWQYNPCYTVEQILSKSLALYKIDHLHNNRHTCTNTKPPQAHRHAGADGGRLFVVSVVQMVLNLLNEADARMRSPGHRSQ